jgi:hypothetical protein
VSNEGEEPCEEKSFSEGIESELTKAAYALWPLSFPLALLWLSRYCPPAVVVIVSFRTYDDRRPSKFILLADNMKSAINMAWEHGGADFSIALRQIHGHKPRG